MSDWQKGIERLDKKAEINFSFYEGFSTRCNNLQLFKALGIYDEVEKDVLENFENAKLKYWGIPNDYEDNEYYNRSERPWVTVSADTQKYENKEETIIFQNDGKEPIMYKEETSTSRTEFQETIIQLSIAMEFNASTNIGVISASSGFSANFSATDNKKVTKNYSKVRETNITLSTGEQLVEAKNPTHITKFKVKVEGKFCLNCSPKYKGHYLWMPKLNKTYECKLIIKDIGDNYWKIEKIKYDSAKSKDFIKNKTR